MEQAIALAQEARAQAVIAKVNPPSRKIFPKLGSQAIALR
jgi:hypothetical protein